MLCTAIGESPPMVSEPIFIFRVVLGLVSMKVP